jgi:hypothetical protein
LLSRVERGQLQMLLDPADTRLEVADQDAVPDGRVVDYRAAKSDDLFAELVTVVRISAATSARSVCMLDLMSATSERTDSKSVLVAISDRTSPSSARHLAQKLEDQAGGLFGHWPIITPSPTGVSLPSRPPVKVGAPMVSNPQRCRRRDFWTA